MMFKTIQVVDRHAALKVFGKNICALRTNLDMTQEQLAEKCDISRTMLAQIEIGRAFVSIESLIALTLALDLKLDKKFWGLGEQT
jgi:transcriptional regulator with XRE-family HTH domain